MRGSYALILLAVALTGTAAVSEKDPIGPPVRPTPTAPVDSTPNVLQDPNTGLQTTLPIEPAQQGASNSSSHETQAEGTLGHTAGQYSPSPINSIHNGSTAKPAPSAKAIREGRRLKGGILRRLALPLLILLGIKAGLALPLLFGGVALAAFKGLWTGSTALVVTAALALRGLIPPPKVIVASPGHHAHVTDYLADYKRADDYRDDYGRYGYGWK